MEFEGQLEEGLSGPSGDIDIWGSRVVEERISVVPLLRLETITTAISASMPLLTIICRSKILANKGEVWRGSYWPTR